MKLCVKHICIATLTISIAILSCGTDQKKTEEKAASKQEVFRIEENMRDVDSTKHITITGRTDDPYAFEYLNLLDFSHFVYSRYQKPEEKSITGDSLSLKLYDIKQPQLLELMAFSNVGDSTPYFTRVFVTPGDKIFMKVNDHQIKYSGQNAAHYNFFLEMNDPFHQNWAIYKNDPVLYKMELQQSYDEKLQFLKEYIGQHPDVSAEFKNLVSSEFKFEYLYHLMLPRNVKDKNSGHYRNSMDDIKYVYATNPSNRERPFDAKSYYGEINIEDFNRPDLIYNDYYKRTLVMYIRHYFTNLDYLEYSKDNFLKEKEFIQTNFSDAIETYAIGRLINDYHMKGFGNGQTDRTILEDLIKEYKVQFSQPTYAARMNEILDDIRSYELILPESVLKEKLLTVKGDSITLENILSNTSYNNLKMLDFWASWCGPCIDDIRKSTAIKKRVGSDYKIDFLYFSIDEDQEKWLASVNNLDGYFNKEQHFLIPDQKNSELLQYLLIRKFKGDDYFAIPRYTVLKKDNSVYSSNAPRPSDSLAFEKLIREIK